ncbi:MAG: prolyl oligopeptidase family serine peptidase, partial [Cyclobacteriaceae bacterium]|nr:prolyl oligopeptidase family serine peptidase [Cyclobacteriaceae bacterium]
LSAAVDFSQARKMYLLHWDVDTLYRPALMGYYRGSPGDTTMVMVQSFVYDVETGKKAPVHLPRTTHINTPTLVWDKNRPVLYALLRERGYKKIQLVRYDLETGAEKILYEETSKTNIDNFSFRVDDGLNAILFLSEKSGWRQLYALDLDNYAIRPLTNGPFYVHTILRADPKKKEIYAMAAGLSPSANPYHQQLISVPFSGGDYSVLTDPSQDHDVAVSPDFGFFVDNAGTLNAPTKTTLRRLPNGKEAATISEADIRKAVEMGYKPPETYTTTGKDGKTTIYGAIWKPTDFDPQKKYPVIDQTYTGPHTHMFPDDFIAGFRRSNQALAELGFIVVAIDGLGTAHRSKAFHDHSYKNMGRNLEDHLLFIRALGQKYSWADTTRVGIFGHSAGGYDAAHALLAFPDFYKVGVASSADHDFRMEKAWWPEMYMGWPVDSSYHEVSNIIMAGNLKGKLLITHGGIDENVNPSATFRLAGALVKANKEFDMLIFPGQQHGYRDDVGEYFRKKRWNYFVQHLLGERPLWEW